MRKRRRLIRLSFQWDSYFISLGLLADGMVDLAQGIVLHFLFEIKHYGKILNGNRSCGISFFRSCRSQADFPFGTATTSADPSLPSSPTSSSKSTLSSIRRRKSRTRPGFASRSKAPSASASSLPNFEASR